MSPLSGCFGEAFCYIIMDSRLEIVVLCILCYAAGSAAEGPLTGEIYSEQVFHILILENMYCAVWKKSNRLFSSAF